MKAAVLHGIGEDDRQLLAGLLEQPDELLVVELVESGVELAPGRGEEAAEV